nr:GSCFA domain-containing protein [Microbacterium sp. NC79]
MQGMYTKKFDIAPETLVATAGSCFAQHISRYMRASGYNVLDAEPGPENLGTELLNEYGYGVYSARYGNIYYVRQLLQLAREALEGWEPAEVTWQRGDRWFDALRPSVEPQGLESPHHVERQRAEHLLAVKSMLMNADVLVFTMGLTEAWEHTESGTVFPTAPGTIAGDYDPEMYRFHNFEVSEVVADFEEFRTLVHGVNPALKFLLTVSPVPLAATATDANVLVATAHSKAVLRAAAGALYYKFDDVDYFPSYEIVTSHAPGNEPFDSTGRNVRSETVEMVMSYFFSQHLPSGAYVSSGQHAPAPGAEANGGLDVKSTSYEATEERVFCEEAILEAFASED